MSKKKADSGFVYIWFDRKHRRFYIGCHWGDSNDDYICSSRWMRKAYRRRPEDFKRRIVSWVYTTRQDLLIEEFRWLKMIKPEEKGKRYYNLRIGPHNSQKLPNTGKMTEEHRRKISEAAKRRYAREKQAGTCNLVHDKGRKFTEEHRRKLCESRKGRQFTEEARRKMSEAAKNREFTEDHKRNLSEAQRQRHSQARELGIVRPVTEEARRKMSEANKGKKLTEEHCRKISESKKNKKFTEEHRRKLSEATKRVHAQRKAQLEVTV